MDLTIEQYERIQKFADGKMTAEEHELFLAELSGNAELMECLDLELFIRGNADVDNATSGEQDPLSNSAYMKSLITQVGNEWHKKKENQQLTTKTGSVESIGNNSKKNNSGFFFMAFNCSCGYGVTCRIFAFLVAFQKQVPRNSRQG